jgi:hypothetical protein
MPKFFRVAAVPLLLPSLALAATATAPIRVSLVVADHCLIQRPDGSAAPAPRVDCALHSPYRIQSVPANASAEPAPNAPAPPSNGVWLVSF